LCREYLSGQLIEAWDILVEDLKPNYLDMRDENVSDLIPEKIDWKNMCLISETIYLSKLLSRPNKDSGLASRL
jgi:hypothetical protein